MRKKARERAHCTSAKKKKTAAAFPSSKPTPSETVDSIGNFSLPPPPNRSLEPLSLALSPRRRARTDQPACALHMREDAPQREQTDKEKRGFIYSPWLQKFLVEKNRVKMATSYGSGKEKKTRRRPRPPLASLSLCFGFPPFLCFPPLSRSLSLSLSLAHALRCSISLLSSSEERKRQLRLAFGTAPLSKSLASFPSFEYEKSIKPDFQRSSSQLSFFLHKRHKKKQRVRISPSSPPFSPAHIQTSPWVAVRSPSP